MHQEQNRQSQAESSSWNLSGKNSNWQYYKILKKKKKKKSTTHTKTKSLIPWPDYLLH